MRKRYYWAVFSTSTGYPITNLRMFEELCGKNAFYNVILSTTMRNDVDEETGRVRKEELKVEILAIDARSQVYDRPIYGYSWIRLRLIEPLIDEANKKSSLLLQQEMVDLRNTLPETSAGVRLFSETERLVKERGEILERLRNVMRHSSQDKTALLSLQKNIRGWRAGHNGKWDAEVEASPWKAVVTNDSKMVSLKA